MAFTPGAGTLELYDSPSVYLNKCWKITRTDAVVHRFTNNTEPLTVYDPFGVGIGGTYTPLEGVEGSNIRTQSGVRDTSTEIRGVIASSEFTIDDIRGGRFRDAEVQEFVVSRNGMEYGSLRRHVFTIGDVSYGETGYTADLRGKTQQLQRTGGRAVTKNCRHTLYQGQCGVGGRVTAPKYTIPHWNSGTTIGPRISNVVSRYEFDVTLPVWNITAHAPGNPHRISVISHAFATGAYVFVNVSGVNVISGLNINQLHWARVVNGTQFDLLQNVAAVHPDNQVNVDTTGGSYADGEVRIELMEAGYLDFGRVVYNFDANDLNDGLSRRIRSQGAVAGNPAVTRIVLDEPFPYDIDPAGNDAVDLEAGCQHTPTDCKVKFNNFRDTTPTAQGNYGGLEDTPGMDRAIRTPDQT